jgi:hypothetical protein
MFKKRVNKSDTIHQIYENQKIKQQLIDYIYSVVDLSKFKYKLLETQDDLPMLTTNKYYISGNYTGPNCLLVFTKNKDRFYSFIVDRKSLSFKQNQINIDKVNINPVELGLEESIYDGTIIDGILSQTEETKVFVVTDLYLFRGQNMMAEKIKYKLINIRKYLDTYMTEDKNLNNFNITINNLYELNEIQTLVSKTIPQTKQLQVRGIAFYPDVSGTKLIYLFNKLQPNSAPSQPKINFDKPRNNFAPQQYQNQPYQNRNKFASSQNETQYKQPEKNTSFNEINPEVNVSKVRYVCKTDEPVILTFEIRKTEQYDVYKLLLVEPVKDNGKTILKTKRFGIAYIPTTICSKMCKDLTMATGKALVKCKYDEAKEKWTPVEADVKRKCPDYVSTLEEKMDVIMDDDENL